MSQTQPQVVNAISAVNEKECEYVSNKFAPHLVAPYVTARRQYGRAKGIGEQKVFVMTAIVGNTSFKSGSAAREVEKICELGVEPDRPVDSTASLRVWAPLMRDALRSYLTNGGTWREWVHVSIQIQSLDGRQSHRYGAASTDIDIFNWLS